MSTTKHVVHLEECEPEQHEGWRKVQYREALELDAAMCAETQYMANELYPNEEVWVETVSEPAEEVATAADLPDGSIVATADKAYIKNHPTPDAPWRGTNGGRHGDWQVQEALQSGEATVVRIGDGT
jgi:hypothetical protein